MTVGRMFCGVLLMFAAACARPIEEATVVVQTTPGGEEMVRVPGGTFVMGCDDAPAEADEGPAHSVTVDPFLMDRREVTQGMFARVQLSDPSRFEGDDLPVDNVTWLLAAQYCNLRSVAEGYEPCYDEATGRCDFQKSGYRLPTEAEWEFACRGEARGHYSFGNDEGALASHGWFADNSQDRTHRVGQKAPNRFGLYDMHGNVAEWCHDPYDSQYYGRSPQHNPVGPEDGEYYVVRGGSFASRSAELRSSARGKDRPGFGDACLAPDTLGLRCVRRVGAEGDSGGR